MRGKVVTSGRLTGRVKMQPARRRGIPNPGAAPLPEPAFSLYSTDSEDQVTSLHAGLDRCAALLSGILQAEEAEAVESPPRVVTSAAATSRASNSLRKRTIKKAAAQTERRTCRSVQPGSGRATPTTRRPSAVPAAHAGVKLRPPPEQTDTLTRSLLRCQTLKPVSSTASPQSTPHSGQTHSKSECDGDEEDDVPVRDVGAQGAAAGTPPAVRRTRSHASTIKKSNVQLGSGALGDVSEYKHDRREANGKTVQFLVGQLKALITGQGSAAEKLLTDLEQCVSPSVNVGSSNAPTSPDQSLLLDQDTQLRRTLNQQFKETEKAGTNETLCNSEVLLLRGELAAARLRLRELQDDLAERQGALQDTRRQLRDEEAKNALVKSDLDATRSRLLDSEREKRELVSVAQQRLEEIGRLKRALQTPSVLPGTTAADRSVSETQDPAEPPNDRIAHYLMSLGQLEPTNTPEQNNPTPLQRSDVSSRPDVQCQPRDNRAGTSARPLSAPLRPSQCDVESVWSEWSVRSGSTFDTRDEAAFRDGLLALDASIATLQKTIELDLGR